MKKLLVLFFLPVLVSAQFAYEGPIPKITSGYGSFGSVPFESALFHLSPQIPPMSARILYVASLPTQRTQLEFFQLFFGFLVLRMRTLQIVFTGVRVN